MVVQPPPIDPACELVACGVVCSVIGALATVNATADVQPVDAVSRGYRVLRVAHLSRWLQGSVVLLLLWLFRLLLLLLRLLLLLSSSSSSSRLLQGSVICRGDRTALAVVEDVFGPVSAPRYVACFPHCAFVTPCACT